MQLLLDSAFSQTVFPIGRRRSSRRDIETKVTIAILSGLPTATFRIILQIRERCKFTRRIPIRVNINTMSFTFGQRGHGSQTDERFLLSCTYAVVLLFRFVRLHVSVSAEIHSIVVDECGCR